jgi:hypothetical protein
MGHEDTIRFFLGKVDIHKKNNIGNTAVAIAAKVNRYEVVELLVKKGGASLEDVVYKVNGFGHLSSSLLTVFFHTVALATDEVTFKWMCLGDGGLARVTSMDSQGNTAFHHVVRKDHLDMSPLMYALENKNLLMTRWLLRSGHAHGDDIVNVDTGETAIFAAARHNRVAIFVDLVDETNPDLNKKNYEGLTVWNMFTWSRLTTEESNQVLSALLSRVAPPDSVLPYMGDHRHLVSESKKLRELIGPFLAERETTLMKLKIPRIPKSGQPQMPVDKLVLPSDVIKNIFTYDSGFTTDQMWATKLGEPKAKRPLF